MMGKKIKGCAVIVLIGVVAVAQFGCKNENTQDPPSKTPLAGVTNLTAYSATESSVGLVWTHSADRSNTYMTAYSITVRSTSGIQVGNPIPISKDSTRAIVPGLIPGVYTFAVRTIADPVSGDFGNSDSVTVRWAPAPRFTTEPPGVEIKVYESNSSTGFASGLVFAVAPDSLFPKTVSIVNPGSYATKIDIYLASSGASSVELRSASLFNPSWRATRFSILPPRETSTLDDPRQAPPDTAGYILDRILIDSLTFVSTSRLYYFKTDNANYGRLLLKRSSNGNLIWGSSHEQYINVLISYQTQPRNPYSKPWRFPQQQGGH